MTDTPIQIPGYTVHRLLGKGGMAAVYLATQESLGRDVAIKVLLKNDDAQFTDRFLSEARIIATLNHPRVITVYDVAQLEDGRPYIVMEYLSGGDLARLKGQNLGPLYALELIRQIAEGLSVVHRRGIIHRDIKPANILFRDDGSVVLTDFGIAKDTRVDCDLTQDGMSIGSPSYSSPEQAYCEPLDQRTDIYSLGVILLELLLGYNPFKGAHYADTVHNHATLPLPELPAPLRQYQPLLEKMLAKNPADRFESVDAMLTVLTDHLHGKASMLDQSITRQHFTPIRLEIPEVPRHRVRWAAVVAVLLILASGALFYFNYDSEHAAQISELLAQANQRLEEDKLVEPELDNARYYFHEVLALDPANSAAQEGLEQVSQRLILRYLKLASERFEQMRLSRPPQDNAFFYYHQVLQLDPANPVAQEGLRRIAAQYTLLAQQAFVSQDFVAGLTYVSQGLEADPENPTLLELRERHKDKAAGLKGLFGRIFN